MYAYTVTDQRCLLLYLGRTLFIYSSDIYDILVSPTTAEQVSHQVCVFT